jgi:hypothetical protein
LIVVIPRSDARQKDGGARTVVLSKRERVIMLQPWDKGLMGTTLRYPYEVRDSKDYFYDIPDVKVAPELLKLAEHSRLWILRRRTRSSAPAFLTTKIAVETGAYPCGRAQTNVFGSGKILIARIGRPSDKPRRTFGFRVFLRCCVKVRAMDTKNVPEIVARDPRYGEKTSRHQFRC